MIDCVKLAMATDSEDPSLVDDTGFHQDEGDLASPQDDNRRRFQGAEREVLDALAGNFARAASYLRIFVIVFLLLASILFSRLAFNYTKAGQVAEFQNSFEGYATELIQNFHATVEKSLEAFDSLSLAITAHALSSNSTFP